MIINIPYGASFIIDRLAEHNFSAYLVGGCVRDAVMGRDVNDWDITTSALPEQICELFADMKVIKTGLAHGTVTVMVDGEGYEVTTFRSDGEYTDHRHPDQVSFASDVLDDLSRRDFTVNAMAYNSQSGLLDPFCGIVDIENRIIRAVGDPKMRFEEDALRILRGMRFASQLGFDIEPATKNAMHSSRDLLGFVSGERIYAELCKLIMGDNAQKVLLDFADVIAVAVPEIAMSVGFDQRNKHHIYNVWEHTVRAVCNTPKDLTCRLVMLLHDCGKPYTFSVDAEGTGHFYGHAKVSACKAEAFFERSGAGNSIKDICCSLINLHDSDLFSGERSIRRWLGKLGLDNLLRLIDIKRADNLAQAPEYMDRLEKLAATRRKIQDIAAAEPCVSKSMLAVDGNHIKSLGYMGREIGAVLDELLDAVIDGRCENSEDALLEYAANLGQCH